MNPITEHICKAAQKNIHPKLLISIQSLKFL